jgi:hypothetical protein
MMRFVRTFSNASPLPIQREWRLFSLHTSVSSDPSIQGSATKVARAQCVHTHTHTHTLTHAGAPSFFTLGSAKSVGK